MGLKQVFLLTDRDVPAYEFYKKNGYVEVSNLVPFAKSL
jgi:aminoglycoside 6'-N-acetyltransferase I